MTHCLSHTPMRLPGVGLLLLALASPALASGLHRVTAAAQDATVSSNQARTVATEDFPGPDAGPGLSARLAAADRALGTGPGTITVDRPGTLDAPVTLRKGHNLLLRTSVTWAATVRLEGGNSIRCAGPRAAVHANLPEYHFAASTGMLLLASGAAGITVAGCRFTSDSQAPVVLAGYPVSHLVMESNTLSGVSLAATSAGTSTDLAFRGNTVDFPAGGPKSGIAAVSLFYAKRVEVSGNHFSRVLHGVQWWGGDSGAAGAKLEQVTAAGEMRMTGNTCEAVGGSCLWGSMGYGITLTGNSAEGCGDVCFDTEGGRDTVISGNTARGCANGCAAIFFFTRNTVISHNHFRGSSPGGGLIFLKNASQDPLRHQGVAITDNDLHCDPGTCRAVYSEAVSGLRFTGNQVTDGTYLPVNYSRSVTLSGNQMRFTHALPAGTAAIAAPAMVGGTTLRIEGNTISSEVPQPPGDACIAASWSDFNSPDLHVIAGNRCGGSDPFPAGIVTTTDGKNPGPRALWVIAGNQVEGPGGVQHHAVTHNEVYRLLSTCAAGVCRSLPGADVPTTAGGACSPQQFGRVTEAGSGLEVCGNAEDGNAAEIPLQTTP